MYKQLLKASTAIIFPLFLISCNKDAESYRKTINIELKSVNQLTINNGKFTATLWGHDPMVQDAPASKITEQSYESNTLPVNIKLNIPKDPDSKIEFRNENLDMKYYLTVEWDANNNQKYDKGDIIMDFNKQFPTVDLKKKNHSFYVYQF